MPPNGFDPILAQSTFDAGEDSFSPVVSVGGFDPVLALFTFNDEVSQGPPGPAPIAGFDPILAMYWFNDEPVPLPPPFRPDDLVEAIKLYLDQNFSLLELPGGVHYLGFKQNNTKWPGIAFWLISNNESRTWDSGPQEFPRFQFNVCGDNEKAIRVLVRKFKRLMRLVKFPNRLFFQGGEASNSMLALEAMLPEDDRVNPGSSRIRGTMLDYVFTVDYDED